MKTEVMVASCRGGVCEWSDDGAHFCILLQDADSTAIHVTLSTKDLAVMHFRRSMGVIIVYRLGI